MTDSNETGGTSSGGFLQRRALEIKEAKKLKLLAKFYRNLERIEDGFEMLEKEAGKLTLAENAEDNFDSYYKFVQPVSRAIDYIKTTSALARTTLQEYRQLDKPESSKSRAAKPAIAFDQLEKRVNALEFKVQIIIAVLVTIAVMLALD